MALKNYSLKTSDGAIAFTNANTVARGGPITSSQMNSLARAFNSRLASGAGDAYWRVSYYIFNMFRQMRNHNDFLYAPEAEFFDFYQFVHPNSDLVWPTTGPGLPEGANVTNLLNAFIFGRDLGSEILNEETFFLKEMIGSIGDGTPFSLAKEQRGAYSTSNNAASSPILEGATLYRKYSFVNGSLNAIPGANNTATNPISHSFGGYRGLSSSGEAQKYYISPFSYSGTSIQKFGNGTESLNLPVEYDTCIYLNKSASDGLGKIINNFISSGFRGSDKQKNSSNYFEGCFDFQWFFNTQYNLAPEIGYAQDGEVLPVYPKYTTSSNGVLLSRVANGVLNWWNVNSGLVSTTNSFTVPNDFVFNSIIISAPILSSGSGILTINISKGAASYSKSFNFKDDPESKKTNFNTYIFDEPIEEGSTVSFVASGLSVGESVSIECSVIIKYKPTIFDAYAILRFASQNLGDKDAQSFLSFDKSKTVEENLKNLGCVTRLISGEQASPTHVNVNAVFESARQLSLYTRIINKENFLGFKNEGGKGVLYFKRWAKGSGKAPNLATVSVATSLVQMKGKIFSREMADNIEDVKDVFELPGMEVYDLNLDFNLVKQNGDTDKRNIYINNNFFPSDVNYIVFKLNSNNLIDPSKNTSARLPSRSIKFKIQGEGFLVRANPDGEFEFIDILTSDPAFLTGGFVEGHSEIIIKSTQDPETNQYYSKEVSLNFETYWNYYFIGISKESSLSDRYKYYTENVYCDGKGCKNEVYASQAPVTYYLYNDEAGSPDLDDVYASQNLEGDSLYEAIEVGSSNGTLSFTLIDKKRYTLISENLKLPQASQNRLIENNEDNPPFLVITSGTDVINLRIGDSFVFNTGMTIAQSNNLDGQPYLKLRRVVAKTIIKYYAGETQEQFQENEDKWKFSDTNFSFLMPFNLCSAFSVVIGNQQSEAKLVNTTSSNFSMSIGRDIFQGIAPKHDSLQSGELFIGLDHVVYVFNADDSSPNNNYGILVDGKALYHGSNFYARSETYQFIEKNGDSYVILDSAPAARIIIRLVDGIYEAPKKNFSNKWLMWINFLPYTNQTTPYRAEVYAETASPFIDRCHVNSYLIPKSKENNVINLGIPISYSPELPPSYRYMPLIVKPPSGGSIVQENILAASDIDLLEKKKKFFKSCQVGNPPYEVEKVLLVKNINDQPIDSYATSFDQVESDYIIKVVLSRKIDGDYETNSSYRTDSNGIEDYLSSTTGSVVNFKIGDASFTNRSGPIAINSASLNQYKGSYAPRFFFLKLIPEAYEDGNSEQNYDSDAGLFHDALKQCEFYLQPMCEGFINRNIPTNQRSCSDMCGDLKNYQTIPDYSYPYLIYHADRALYGQDEQHKPTRWNPLMTFNTRTPASPTDLEKNLIGSSLYYDKHPLRIDNPQGYGPLPNTECYSETFNILAAGVNLLKTYRIPMIHRVLIKRSVYAGKIKDISVRELDGSITLPKSADVCSGQGSKLDLFVSEDKYSPFDFTKNKITALSDSNFFETTWADASKTISLCGNMGLSNVSAYYHEGSSEIKIEPIDKNYYKYAISAYIKKYIDRPSAIFGIITKGRYFADDYEFVDAATLAKRGYNNNYWQQFTQYPPGTDSYKVETEIKPEASYAGCFLLALTSFGIESESFSTYLAYGRTTLTSSGGLEYVAGGVSDIRIDFTNDPFVYISPDIITIN